MDDPGGRHRHRHHHHHGAHGIMSGAIVAPYDLIVGGLLMRGVYRRIAVQVSADLAAGAKVLDVGTGPGRLPAVLHRIRPDLVITAIDPSTDMLDRARRRTTAAAVTFVEAGAEALPLPTGSQSVVVSSLSSHHWADLGGALSEQARVLAPGGRLWVFDLRSHADPDLGPAIERSGLGPVPVERALGPVVGRYFAVFSGIKPV